MIFRNNKKLILALQLLSSPKTSENS